MWFTDKTWLKPVLATAIAGTLAGCSYGMVETAGDKVVIARQDNFLFGALRTMYVCKVTDAGLSDCADNESP